MEVTGSFPVVGFANFADAKLFEPDKRVCGYATHSASGNTVPECNPPSAAFLDNRYENRLSTC
jgi:hypothetical protein